MNVFESFKEKQNWITVHLNNFMIKRREKFENSCWILPLYSLIICIQSSPNKRQDIWNRKYFHLLHSEFKIHTEASVSGSKQNNSPLILQLWMFFESFNVTWWIKMKFFHSIKLYSLGHLVFFHFKLSSCDMMSLFERLEKVAIFFTSQTLYDSLMV